MPDLAFSFLAGTFLATWGGVGGCFLVWQRLSFIADAFAHAALLGVALALIWGIAPFWGIFLFACASALGMACFRDTIKQTSDAVVMSISAIAMALGLWGIASVGGGSTHVMTYLVGAREGASTMHCFGSIPFAVLAGVWLFAKHRQLLSCAVVPELSAVEGMQPRFLEFGLILCLFMFVLLALWWAGALLLTLLLVAPLLVVQPWVQRPLACLVGAGIVGAVGFALSFVLAHYGQLSLGIMLGIVWGTSVSVSRCGAWMISQRKRG